jgi:hypothetical protein
VKLDIADTLFYRMKTAYVGTYGNLRWTGGPKTLSTIQRIFWWQTIFAPVIFQAPRYELTLGIGYRLTLGIGHSHFSHTDVKHTVTITSLSACLTLEAPRKCRVRLIEQVN